MRKPFALTSAAQDSVYYVGALCDHGGRALACHCAYIT